MTHSSSYILADAPIEINAGRLRRQVRVRNVGDRPIQVGSHFHFCEVNPSLVFEREVARGMRLDIPSGTAIRFEPGDEREVGLVAIGGGRPSERRHALEDRVTESGGGSQ